MTQQVVGAAAATATTAVVGVVVAEIKRDLPIAEMAIGEIVDELRVMKKSHASTHTMAADVFHRSIDLLLELVTREGPHTPQNASEEQ